MPLTKIKILNIFFALLILVHHSDASRRRRRRRSCGEPYDCILSSWSSWSSCTATECGKQGSQTRKRTISRYPVCGGRSCSSLFVETRQCHGMTLVNCTVTAWSEWSSCTSPCGVSGMQSSSRHRIVTEKCGGKCVSTFRKTRTCPQITPCLHGGSFKGGVCFCKEGFSGYCCEKVHSNKINCQLSPWSEWSVCNDECGTQSSSRYKLITEQNGGTCISTFRKTRACPLNICLNGGSLEDGACFCKEGYSGRCCEKANCKMSPWSAWSSCTTQCGVSGTQSSSRKHLKQNDKTCTSALQKTRLCPQLSCLNGGSLEKDTCFCNEGYSGVCCEKAADKHLFWKIFSPFLTVAIIIAVFVLVIRKCKNNSVGQA